jgi:hypothetical protein
LKAAREARGALARQAVGRINISAGANIKRLPLLNTARNPQVAAQTKQEQAAQAEPQEAQPAGAAAIKSEMVSDLPQLLHSRRRLSEQAVRDG